MEIVKKREDYISWEDFFMAVACVAAMRSKDPGSQVGACIVNEENKIVGVGYNGLPRGCSDDDLPWNSEADNMLDLKYTYVCHAESNSILNKNESDTRGCRMFVTLFPCNECAKLIIQSGIKEVIYMSDKYHDRDFIRASRKLLDMAGVKYSQHIPKTSKIVVDFNGPW